jgi:putative ABC transport system substrate-binding protein
MRRRDFVKGIVGLAAALPAVARAQQPNMPLIGFLNGQSPQSFKHLVAGFLQGLREAGYVEGQNVQIEFRWAKISSSSHDSQMSWLISRLRF